ncbi:MAG TPA: hypothetical protein VFL80_06760 [Thermoanaerobaculia bacterium]|nr:hypothetical protein [Thermoanaerobaculia bacterium]
MQHLLRSHTEGGQMASKKAKPARAGAKGTSRKAATRKATTRKTATKKASTRKAGIKKGGMKTKSSTKGALSRAATSVKKVLKRGSKAALRQEASASARPAKTNPRPPKPSARPTQRKPDIPLEQIAKTYTPKQTNGKASFRTDGGDRQRDQEFGRGIEDGRWNDEDRLTNKSGDPRIGTHGRSYEPGEPKGSARPGK